MALRYALFLSTLGALSVAAAPVHAGAPPMPQTLQQPSTGRQPSSSQQPQTGQQPRSMQQPKSMQKPQTLPQPLSVPSPPMPQGRSPADARISPAARQAHMQSNNAQGGSRTSTVNNALIQHQISINGKALKLNGAGTLTNWIFFKQYVIALYLVKPGQTAAQVVLAPGAKSVQIHMLTNKSKQDLVSTWNDAIKANTPNKFSQIKKAVNKFDSLLADVQAKDQLTFNYLPSSGTIVKIKGKRRGVIAGKKFYRALLRVWLGQQPVSGNLKQKLLGQSK